MKNTPKYQNEWHRLRVNLITTTSWLNGEVKKFLAPFGITQKQFNILRILRGHKGEIPLSILEVRERMMDRMSDASRLVDRLVQRSLIHKKPCTEDKRATRVSITQEGLELLAEIDQHLGQLDAIFGTMTETEAAQLNEKLEDISGKSSS